MLSPTPPIAPAPPPRLERLFRFLLARRWWVVAIHAVLVAPAIFFALRVTQDNSLDRLIVDSDPDAIANRKFEEVFGSGAYLVLVAEADDPFAPAVLAKLDGLERALAGIPKVEPQSVLSLFRRAHAGFTPAQAGEVKEFATGTEMFRRQGLVGDHHLGVPLVLSVSGTAERRATVEAIDRVLANAEANPAPLRSLGKVGQPYVDAQLDRLTSSSGNRCFALFMLFVVLVTFFLYRSVRTVAAFLIALAVSVAHTIGYVGATGGTFTLVSALVPMTILISCTATLVYIQSRFVEKPPERSVDDQIVFTLRNKALACSASLFATAAGFAALAVSDIRPIRQMGIWVAVGLVLTWLVVFTLYPALQKILATPTAKERGGQGGWFLAVTERLPSFSYRFRWLLVPGTLLLCVAGVIALVGVPRVISPMKLETSGIEYLPHDSPLYKDTKRFEKAIGGLAVTTVWLKSARMGSVTDPEVVRGLDNFQRALEREPGVGTVVGLTTIVRSLRYIGGEGDELPVDAEALEDTTTQIETLLPREPSLQRYIDRASMSQTHVDVITRTVDWDGFQRLNERIRAIWRASVARDPALGQFELKTVGSGLLQAKISHRLVPTLLESFAISVGVIFTAFLLLFRNGPARVMAMIPSLFAILVMFLVMRLTGMTLNVATILVASTVLGTSENDQIHFFYHLAEEKGVRSTEQRLQHTLRIAGRAILFATLINAVGFLGFGLSGLPPMRQFGLLSALAFTLSMIADFTALPAALWLIARDRPTSALPLPIPPTSLSKTARSLL